MHDTNNICRFKVPKCILVDCRKLARHNMYGRGESVSYSTRQSILSQSVVNNITIKKKHFLIACMFYTYLHKTKHVQTLNFILLVLVLETGETKLEIYMTLTVQ